MPKTAANPRSRCYAFRTPKQRAPFARLYVQMTPFEISLQNELSVERQRFANDWLFKWHGMTYAGGVTHVDDFRGGHIHYAGIRYGAQQQQIFWQALNRYLLAKIHETFKQWDTGTAQYSVATRLLSLDGVQRLLHEFVHCVAQKAQDTDQRLRGQGHPQTVTPYDGSRHMNAAHAQIDRIAQAHKALLAVMATQERRQTVSALENIRASTC